MVDLLAWLATVSIVGTYALLGRTGRAVPFHLANAIGACVLAPVNLAAGVPAQAVLSAVFGVIGFKALGPTIADALVRRIRIDWSGFAHTRGWPGETLNDVLAWWYRRPMAAALNEPNLLWRLWGLDDA